MKSTVHIEEYKGCAIHSSAKYYRAENAWGAQGAIRRISMSLFKALDRAWDSPVEFCKTEEEAHQAFFHFSKKYIDAIL